MKRIHVQHPPGQTVSISDTNQHSQYRQFFKEVQHPARDTLLVDEQQLRINGIALGSTLFKPEGQLSPYEQPKVFSVGIHHGAAVVVYNVALGPYVVNIRMLNMNSKESHTLAGLLDQGSFGKIVALADEHGEFVCKRVRLTKSANSQSGKQPTLQVQFTDVKQVLLEYAVAKLCSQLFKVGPKIKLDMGFDLVCYRDCIEFYMERCIPLQYALATMKVENLQERLKYCVAVMHCHRFAHRDIKPVNIVFSPYFNNFVFCDFGISHPLPCQPGFQSKAYCDGSMKYMSQDLKRLTQQGGLVDLYYNDMFALQVSLREIGEISTGLGLDHCETSRNLSIVSPTPRIMSLKATGRTFFKGETKSVFAANSLIGKMLLEVYEPKPEFLFSSLGISYEFCEIISKCNGQLNPMLRRARNLADKPSIVKKEYESFQFVEQSAHPTKYLDVRMREMERLDSSLLLTKHEKHRQWVLMAEILSIISSDSAKIEDSQRMLKRIKSERILPYQDQFEGQIQAVLRVTTRPISSAELTELLSGCSDRTKKSIYRCLIGKGDFKGSFEALSSLQFCKNIAQGNDLLNNLFSVYRECGRQFNLNIIELENSFRATEERPNEWRWLLQLHLLLMSQHLSNSKACFQQFEKYLPRIESKHHPPLIRIAVNALTNLGRYDEAVKWQQRAVELAQFSLRASESIMREQGGLVMLKARIPGNNRAHLAQEMLTILNSSELIGCTFNLCEWSFVARLLAEQGEYAEAERISNEQEIRVVRMCSTRGLVHFYSMAAERYLEATKSNAVEEPILRDKVRGLIQKVANLKVNKSNRKLMESIIHFVAIASKLLIRLSLNMQVTQLHLIVQWLAQSSRVNPKLAFQLFKEAIERRLAQTLSGEAEGPCHAIGWLIDHFQWKISERKDQKIVKGSISLLAQSMFADNLHQIALSIYEESPEVDDLQYFMTIAMLYNLTGRHKEAMSMLMTLLQNTNISPSHKDTDSELWQLLLGDSNHVGKMRELFNIYKRLQLTQIKDMEVRLKTNVPILQVRLLTNPLLNLDWRLRKHDEYYAQGRTHKAYRHHLIREQLRWLTKCGALNGNELGYICQLEAISHNFPGLSKAYAKLQDLGASEDVLERIANKLEKEGMWVEVLLLFDRTFGGLEQDKLQRLEYLKHGDTLLTGEVGEMLKYLKLAKEVRRKRQMMLKYGCLLSCQASEFAHKTNSFLNSIRKQAV